MNDLSVVTESTASDRRQIRLDIRVIAMSPRPWPCTSMGREGAQRGVSQATMPWPDASAPRDKRKCKSTTKRSEVPREVERRVSIEDVQGQVVEAMLEAGVAAEVG
jgi:hypothetical protein